jgi:hypothetical protein
VKSTPMRDILVCGETPEPWSDELKTGALSGLQLKACSVALEEFSKKYPAAQLDYFIVIAKDELDGFEVTFLPESDDCQVYGGDTKCGRELIYVISGDKFEIIRTYFSR